MVKTLVKSHGANPGAETMVQRSQLPPDNKSINNTGYNRQHCPVHLASYTQTIKQINKQNTLEKSYLPPIDHMNTDLQRIVNHVSQY